MRVMYWTLKRQKSMSSHAASISAWCAVFDWPSIVAALRVCRQGPARSSGTRKMPWVLTAAILGFVVVAVTQVSYEVEGWGVGELVVADARVVWHDLPWPRAERPPRDRAARPQDPSQTPAHPGRGRGSVVSQKSSSPDRGFVTEVVRLLQAYFEGEQVP